jgi:uncharacterized protein YndB with AHSA1/START domain
MLSLSFAITFQVPIDRVWAALTDYEGYVRFPKVQSARVLEQGKDHPAGIGTLRELRIDGLTFKERIVEFDAPYRLAYKIEESKPLPLKHEIGRMVLSEQGGATHLEWSTTFAVGIPVIGGPLTHVARYMMRRTFQEILEWVKKDLEGTRP